MSKIKVGLALCGSYCSYEKLFEAAEELCEHYDVLPLMSETASKTDTRFGSAEEHIKKLEELTGKKIITEIKDAEPLGPQGAMDVMVIAPCTGNTLAKLALGLTDSGVTMAAKSHLRNGKPLVIAVSTNDGLSGSAANLAVLLNKKNVYFVPFGQDDPFKKPTSLVADFELIEETIDSALKGVQLQPILLRD